MATTFFGAAFDAVDAARAARFWAATLDRDVADGADENDAVGARWTTFADLEGNEFDLIAG
jgi:hypothetical protein